jgi:hypothetical protein
VGTHFGIDRLEGRLFRRIAPQQADTAMLIEHQRAVGVVMPDA